MEIHNKNGRALFPPYTYEPDKAIVQAQKEGVRTHNVVSGFILSIIGKAERLHDDKTGKDVYVNVNSAVKWLGRQGITEVNSAPGRLGSHLLLEEAIKSASELARLNVQIKIKPNDVNLYFQKANIYYKHGNLKEAIVNYTKCIDLTPGPQLKLKYLGFRADCYERQGVKFAADKDNKTAVAAAVVSFTHALQDLKEMENINPNSPNPVNPDDPIRLHERIRTVTRSIAKVKEKTITQNLAELDKAPRAAERIIAGKPVVRKTLEDIKRDRAKRAR